MTDSETSTGMDPKVAGLLCYLGAWITGIIFIVLEQKNRYVRFHAVQSIIVFGFLGVAGAIFGWIPVIGNVFSSIIGITAFILWIVLMVKAYHGEMYKVPVAGDLAMRALSDTDYAHDASEAVAAEAPGPAAAAPTPAPERTSPPPLAVPYSHGKPLEYIDGTRVGRVLGSSFIIAFSFALMIFFSFYQDYLAIYNGGTGAAGDWLRYPILSTAYSGWYPLLMTALGLSIAGHIMVIIIDRYVLREGVLIALNLVWITVMANLLRIFPFDFSALPDPFISGALNVIFKLAIIGVIIGLTIGSLVASVKLITSLVRGSAST